ncbi:restriction endonuclease subunit S [Snodgrassella alvi]|uniref:restriction endonuclease subunit S n=1 Tax=Snodgrassella alvi TaxID=1196083 RepID=UPI003519BC11
MAKYKAYPEYKDSGVEWLGEIPTHWDCTALKRLCSLITGLTPPTQNEDNYADEGYPWVRPEDLNESGFGTHASKYVSDIGWKLLRHIKPNSTLICCIGTIGKCGYVKETVSTNQQITAATFRDSERFNYYLLQAARAQLEELATGNVLKILNSERLGALNVVKVNCKEANTIAEFLDHETAKINNLIEKQQQLIELLKEKRQAVISHAVTKGLNSDVPMKDSGVEWLGDIPSHWLCTKIKHIALLTPKKSSVNFKNNDECTFIPMEKLKRNSLVTDESKLIRDVISGYTYFEDGDLLLAKVTPCFENKNIAVAKGLVNSIGFGSTEIYVLRPTEKIRVNYLLYRLQEDNFIRAATAAMTGAGGLRRVPSDFLLNYPIAIPPKPEMDAIIAYLNAQEVHYDLMEKNATQAVQLLQERRTALISAAVTGKIDVRD